MSRPPAGLVVWLAFASCSRGESAWRAGFVNAPVAAVAAQTTGRIESIGVREGERVRRGQLLAQIEAAERQAAVAEAQANLERARQSLSEAEANLAATTPTQRSAAADVDKARAALIQAQLDFDRAERLVRDGALSQSELDAARSRLDQARATLASAVAGRAGTGGRIGAAEASVANARAAVLSSQAAVDLARAQLAQTQVLSPFDAVVVSRNLEEGEWTAPGTPVVTVEDLGRAWVRLDVGEGELGGVRLTQTAEVRVVALPGRVLRAHVAEIGVEGDFALNRDVKRGRPDLRTFMVRVQLDEGGDAVMPGMTAEVRLGPTPPAAPPGGPQVTR